MIGDELISQSVVRSERVVKLFIPVQICFHFPQTQARLMTASDGEA